MTIFEIDQAILSCIDQETGEVIDLDALMQLQMDRSEKCENIACWILELQAEAKAIREQEAILKARRDSAERKAERLKGFLGEALCGEKLKTGKVSVSYRKTSAVEIAEGAELPEQYLTTKVSVAPDKAAIKAALMGGEEIAGCSIVERQAIQIK